jgi:ABC-type Fe3+-hydroxamate transport system substrate-binding protein
MDKQIKLLYYLASPYTHDDYEVMKKRAVDVTQATIKYLTNGVTIFAPISYNGHWVEDFNIQTDWGFWKPIDLKFIDVCDGGLLVLMLDGWQDSLGVTEEIAYCEELGIPVRYVDPDNVEESIKELQEIDNKRIEEHLKNKK